MRILHHIIICCILSTNSYSQLDQKFTSKQADAEEAIKAKIYTYLTDFEATAFKLDSLEKLDLSEEDLKKPFLLTREAFKKIEFLLSYLDNPISKRLNGANLVTNEYNSSTPKEQIVPHGLQVIEDLIYNPDDISRAKLKKEINLLLDLISYIISQNTKHSSGDTKSYHTIIWDCFRYEIYRVEALGITGFDVPESENAIPETRAILISMLDLLQAYKESFKLLKKTQLWNKGNKLFEAAIQYTTKNDEFNSFNRLEFINDYLHPISSWLNEITVILDIVYPSNHRPIDSSSNHLFSKNLLNPNFFSSKSSPAKIKLGEILFSDTVLSSGNQRSCVSCHLPSEGFSDGLNTNFAIDGRALKRNTPTLWNVAFQTKQFHDSRVRTLERQHLLVIISPTEMGGDFDKIIASIEKSKSYQALFETAFQGKISKNTIIEALACFVQSLVSFDAPIDQYFRGDVTTLSTMQKEGFNLFTGKAKCATCHFMPLFNGLVPPTFSETESEIIGVPLTRLNQAIIDSDQGKFEFSGLPIHKNAFKTPSLRNIELTAPYMHNGVFETLDEVIDFYNEGGGAGQGMDLPNQTLSSAKLNLTDLEKKQLIEFMKALTDTSQYPLK